MKTRRNQAFVLENQKCGQREVNFRPGNQKTRKEQRNRKKKKKQAFRWKTAMASGSGGEDGEQWRRIWTVGGKEEGDLRKKGKET